MILAAATLVVAAALVAPRTGWLQPRPRYSSVPDCAALMGLPAMVDAVRTAFGVYGEQRRQMYTDFPDAPRCAIDLIPAVSLEDYPKRETPWFRYLVVGLHLTREDWDSARSPIFLRGGVGEAREKFRQDRRNQCQKPSGATDLRDEPGFGDEAFSCWTTSDRTPSRYLGFRVSNVSFSIELGGDDFAASSSRIYDSPALLTELDQNTRCIAEVLATHFQARVTEHHHCGATDQSL